MFAPSVRKEYLKRSQQANLATQNAYKAYDEARKKYALEIGAYQSARLKYEQAMTAFGQAKFNQIAEKKLMPAGNDMNQIQVILHLGSKVMEIGGEFGVEIDKVTRLHNQYQHAVDLEKKAWDALHKYMADKQAIKGMGETEYKKWKKELRAELFK